MALRPYPRAGRASRRRRFSGNPELFRPGSEPASDGVTGRATSMNVGLQTATRGGAGRRLSVAALVEACPVVQLRKPRRACPGLVVMSGIRTTLYLRPRRRPEVEPPAGRMPSRSALQ